MSEETRSLRIGRWLVIVLVVSLIAIIVFRYWRSDGGSYTYVPKELQLNYKPSELNLNLDEEETLAILSNPKRYRREFDNLIYEINLAILDHVAKRMGLSENLTPEIRKEYEKHHAYLRDLYYQDFTAIKDTTSTLYQTWYDNESSNAVEAMHEVASRYTCFLANHVITTFLKTEDGSVFARGESIDTPCGIATTEALAPLMKRLEERAAVEDFGRSRGLLQEKVEEAIAELATMEVRDKKGLSKQLQTKIWGFSVSSTDIEVSAISILKVGFRLNEYFDVSLNSRAGIVTVTLPEPTVLSHEVYPKLDKLSIGWLRELKDVDLNESFNLLREEFRREAYESDIMDKAKTQARDLINTMFGPAVSAINKRYQVRVQFREIAEQSAAASEYTNTES